MDTFSVTSYEVVNKEKAKSVENNISGNAEGIGTKPVAFYIVFEKLL